MTDFANGSSKKWLTSDDDNNGDGDDHYDWNETLYLRVAAVTLSLYLMNHSRLFSLVS